MTATLPISLHFRWVMDFTPEQESILNTKGHIKINAVAGSGKTTTVIEYAKRLPKSAKILYLGFNKSVRLEAQEKFRKAGLKNVTAETAHSLAHKYTMRGSNLQLQTNGYKIHELAQLLGLVSSGEKHGEYILANHISKFAAYFCNSSANKVDELEYLKIISDAKAKRFVQNYKRHIYKGTRMFLAKMNSGEIAITHDFYLKKFQLSEPALPFDYILFDEGQDASAAMLDVFLKQKAIKIIVGDEHQQIYGWRHAVNSLAQVDFQTKYLTNSFRFDESIARVANHILAWKAHLNQNLDFKIKGQASTKTNKSKAVLARTNLGLLLKAIEYVSEKDKQNIYFEGNINSYTYADDGTSLYDVLNLHLGKRRLIKDELIGTMRDLRDLEEYIESTQDLQLAMMVEVVKEYGEEIPSLIKDIKDRHVDGDDKSKAEIVFSTVHRSKGMEYDEVQLVNDFITEERLKKILEEEGEKADKDKLNEEVNLFYVAATRAKSMLYLPENSIPVELLTKNSVKFYKVKVKEDSIEFPSSAPPHQKITTKPDSAYAEIRVKHQSAYLPWKPETDKELAEMYCDNISVKKMAQHFSRTEGAIRSRIKKLKLRELYK